MPKGTTFGIVGHNGSGKSTLAQVHGQHLPARSRARSASTGACRRCSSSAPGFHPELSGRENVYLNGSILGLSQRQVASRFDEIVAFSGLERFIDSPVKNYSSGMFVRLGFAVAINVEPEVLLVDEVLAVGDESFQQKCLERFADLRRGGNTIVVVTHSLDTRPQPVRPGRVARSRSPHAGRPGRRGGRRLPGLRAGGPPGGARGLSPPSTRARRGDHRGRGARPRRRAHRGRALHG